LSDKLHSLCQGPSFIYHTTSDLVLSLLFRMLAREDAIGCVCVCM